MAAYLIMNGVQLIRGQKLGRSFKFTFADDSRIDHLLSGWVGSESSRFDDNVRKLKGILYNGRNGNA